MNTHQTDNHFSNRVLTWFDRHGRKHLPWQQQPTPYHVWVSEIMLQQTQVTTVIPYYQRFMVRFPDVSALATAGVDEVLHYWTGLGYYARARHLHQAAQHIHSQHHGIFPTQWAEIVALPGVGRSTAGAIMALAYGQRYAILDGNVKRVLCRYHAITGWSGSSAVSQSLWALAEKYTPANRVADYTQAMMDLGALICRRRGALCEECPLHSDCQAYRQQAVDAYPHSKPRKATPENHLIVLVIVSEKGLLLEKRPDTGIWGGLWSLPQVSDMTAIADWCKTHCQFTPTNWHTWPSLSHQLTHLRLHLHPVAIVLPEGNAPNLLAVAPSASFCWYNFDAPPALGLPAPVVRLVEQIKMKC
ncbi:A/G-specific adenine glycosylase [Thioflexithrix psekupsensis]|uniref:Adenine DNA glycosylase n=1 Tax=Thioflexithrix psekupsensis TaxID=1570016 RepID=A0A251X9U5_9GAMM|nr:A/G-specific adenine glycosylase [Thioflexithrix psekupsensis]OUD15020.1 A/G-specific adenine glycosylase [Thioflexithrix psekupsensis]